jgi:hypothetical protein
LLGLGLLLANRARSQTEFQLTYGLLVGMASRQALFCAHDRAATAWFTTNRSLAVSRERLQTA